VTEEGGSSWYFITADYAFGNALEADTTNVVKSMGGKVVGTSKHPLNASDFASFLLQAQSSGAKVVGLANAGKDTQNTIKQANEFGITKKQTVATLLVFDSDIKALGLPTAQGLVYTTAFYWDLDPETRAFSNRFNAIHKGMPTMVHAGAYSATMHYLKALDAAKTDAADAVLDRMRQTPVNDFFARNGTIRKDGRMVHDMYLAQVKTPAESKGEWDIAQDQSAPSPARAQAFKPLSASTCPLVKS
jgi:branched-chain amino acid transport system substrate-binding protein